MQKGILLFCLLLMYFESFTQEQKQDLKVGLVLSGGGAKGLAHIGVLKVIEEAGVRIDYIGGTSMGAIIGGLYASGYSANQIDSIFKVTNFDKLIQDNLPRAVKSFYEKENDEKYAITLPFYKFKVGIPLSLSKGQNVYNLLNELTYRVSDTSDFSKLPIPFLCIATDIETGEQIILNKGYLPLAMKASGAFPSLFSPVEIDGKILIDGGVVNNYPLDEVKSLGADIIIGVDVQDDLKKGESIYSAANVLMQIVNFQMYQGMDVKAKATDIYIKPNIKGYNVASFNAGEQIIKKGEAAAEVFKEKLIGLAAKQTKSKPARRFDFMRSQAICIDKIIIEGNENYSRSYILGKLRIHSNRTIAFKDLNDGINSLNATQNFKKIDYQLIKTENGENLLLNLKENNNNKSLLKFALHYDGLYKSGALVNFTKKNLLFNNDVASMDMILGDNVRYNLDYYIDNGFYWSFGINSRFNTFKYDVFINNGEGTYLIDQINNLKYSDFTNQIYLQTILRQVFAAGVGVQHKFLKMESEIINPLEILGGIEKNNYLALYNYLKYDTYDNKYFPREGILFNGNFQWYLFSSSREDSFGQQFSKFSMVQGEFGIARTYLDNITFRLKTEGGFTLGELSSNGLSYLLGGYGFNAINNIKSFYGYDFLSLSGESYIKGTLGVDYQFLKNNHLNFYANYANIGYKIYDRLEDWFSRPTHSGYALGYGLESLLGPIEIKYTWSPELKQNYWLFVVGFWF